MSAPATHTTYRWGAGRDQVAARPIAYLPTKAGGWRVLARDTAERLHVLDVDAAGAATVVAGPVTLQEAVAAAERVVMGLADHGSVTRMVKTLAIAVVGMCTLPAALDEGDAA